MTNVTATATVSDQRVNKKDKPVQPSHREILQKHGNYLSPYEPK